MAAKYRAEHIGSFLRPAELLQARSANVGDEQLRALEDKHILQVIQRQKDLGFKIFTDGELRRGNFMSDFNDAVEGIDEGVAVARTWQTSAGPSSRPSMVPGTIVGNIKQKRRLTEHEFAFVKQHSPGDVKSPCPPPTSFPRSITRKGSVTKSIRLIPTFSGTSCRSSKPRSRRWSKRERNTCRSTRRATVITSIRNGAATLKMKWDSILIRRSTKRSASIMLVWKAPNVQA